jgi:hypothetical protein
MAWWSGEKGVDALLTFAIGSSALSLTLSKYQSRAPYGRFGKPSNFLSLDPRLGWLLMELPASVCFAYGFRRGLLALRARADKEVREAREAGRPAPQRPSGSLVRAVLCALWARHYLNRGFYFPLTIRVAEGGQTSFALFNSAIGALFVGVHGYLNGRAFSDLGGYTDKWLSDPRFLLGAAIYEAGFWTILHSEHTLKNLRPAGQVVSAADRYKMCVRMLGVQIRCAAEVMWFGAERTAVCASSVGRGAATDSANLVACALINKCLLGHDFDVYCAQTIRRDVQLRH